MSTSILKKGVHCGQYLNNVLCSSSFISRSFSNKSSDMLKKAKPFESIPKVPMVPLIGSAWAYLPYIGKYSVEKMHIADIHKHVTYGDVVREKFGRFEMVNCYHPDAMHTIMKEDDEYPSRGDFATLKAYRNKRKDWYQPGGLLVTEGKEWKALRDTIQDYTSKPEFLEYYLDPMNNISRDFVELIRCSRDNKEEIDNAVTYLNKWSLEAISFVALDKRLGLLKDIGSKSNAMEMIKAIEVQLDCMNKLEASAGNFPLWKYMPTPTWRKFVKAADTFTSLAFNHLTRSAFEAKQSKGKGRQSLLQYLTKTENSGVSSAMILMTDLMMAGMDTTSYTAGFLLYDLARNPQKQEEAVKEVTKLLPSREEKLTYAKFKSLTYLGNCLKESMRLHPVARGNIRIFKNDVVICGYRIPAGTAVICVLQVVYRDPKYFPMPHDFLPERWEKEHSFFQPFGYGGRNCIGSTLAELEILTMAVEVLRNFTLEYHYGNIGMTTKLINTPDTPMRLRLQERELCK